MRDALSLIIAVAAFFFATIASATDHEAEARKLEQLLMAPCCGANTLAVHNSGPASEMKLEIRELLASGMSRQEILDHYVAKHGTTILSMPETSGFGLVAYLVPILALILGPLLVWRVLARWRTDSPREEAIPNPEPAPPVDPKYLERIEEELRGYR